jgi:hypothetical protein
MLDFSDEVLGTSDTFHEMFRVLERDSMKGTKRMSFRHISILADEVVRNAKMAAAATKAQRELGTPAGSTGATTHFMCDVGGIGGGSHREEQYEPPIAQAGEGNPASNGMGKVPSPKARQVVREEVVQRADNALVFLPTIGRSMITALTAAPERLPQPQAVVIDLEMVRRARHDRTTPF